MSSAKLQAWLMSAGFTTLVSRGEALGSKLGRVALTHAAPWQVRVDLGNSEVLLATEANVRGARFVVLQWDNPLCSGEPWLFAAE
jgi:hypothetical protein